MARKNLWLLGETYFLQNADEPFALSGHPTLQLPQHLHRHWLRLVHGHLPYRSLLLEGHLLRGVRSCQLDMGVRRDVLRIRYHYIHWLLYECRHFHGHEQFGHLDFCKILRLEPSQNTVNFQTMLVLYRRKTQLSSNDEVKRRRRVEIRFFTQSCIQGVMFFYEVFNFYYIVTLRTEQWFVFMTSTFAWELCHCLDGSVVSWTASELERFQSGRCYIPFQKKLPPQVLTDYRRVVEGKWSSEPEEDMILTVLICPIIFSVIILINLSVVTRSILHIKRDFPISRYMHEKH